MASCSGRTVTGLAPFDIRAKTADGLLADMAELVPGSRRTGGRTVEYTGPDYREVFRAWRAMYNLASVE